MQMDAYQSIFGLSERELDARFLVYGNAWDAAPCLPAYVARCTFDEASSLPFKSFEFDMALCAGALLTDDLSMDTSMQRIRELARVAKEVRIYPLNNAAGLPFPQLGPVLLALHQERYGVEVREVVASTLKRGHALLRVWAQECALHGARDDATFQTHNDMKAHQYG